MLPPPEKPAVSVGGSVQTFARAGPTANRSQRTGEASWERALLQPAVELQSCTASSQCSQK